MRILVHILVGYVVLGLASMHSMVNDDIVRRLSLAGPILRIAMEFCGPVLLAVYATVAFFTRKSSRLMYWTCGTCAVMLAAIGNELYWPWLIEHRTQKINIGTFVADSSEFLSQEEVTRFEQRFNTRTVQYSATGSGGPVLVVRRDEYSTSMIDFLRGLDRGKAEQHGADPRQPSTTP